MDIISLRRRIDRLVHANSASLVPDILTSRFSCIRCGWCCQRNFDIRITEDISRPSNAISIFPGDIRRIVRMTGCKWEEVAEPDRFSCLCEGDDVLAIGWILKRNNEGNCTFYSNGKCSIYDHRPVICRIYPFFMKDCGVEIMHCNGLGKEMKPEDAAEAGMILKRYEMKKLQSYIRIIEQIGDKLNFVRMKSLHDDHSGYVTVYDGENISECRI